MAALFAWHPLHVESVAWAAERKDVLSAFFWMLTLIAYTQYAQKWRSVKADTTVLALKRSTLDTRLLLALLFFACGLMSKPMVVTLPFVLLLLDFWPLERFSRFTFYVSRSEKPSTLATESAVRLIVEKLPFFALTLAASVVTYFVQTSGRALWSSAELSFRPGWQTPCGPTSVTSPKPFGRWISQLFTRIRITGRRVWH